MQITRANIAPFLDAPIPEGRYTAVDAWLTAVSATLNSRFGTVLPEAIAPAVYSIVADVIVRRLDRGKNGDGGGLIKRQQTGPSSVEYNVGLTALSGWFWPDEANQLGDLFGNGGGTLTSVRTPAPDGIRYGNLSTHDYAESLAGLGIEYSDVDETGEGDYS
jgi:hypothetical protein